MLWGNIHKLFSLSLSSLCVIYHRRRRSVHSSKNYKTYEFSKISLWHNKNLKTVSFFISLKKKNFFSLCGGPVMGNIFLFSLSQSFFSLCVIYPRAFSQSTAQNYKNLCCPLIHSFIVAYFKNKI